MAGYDWNAVNNAIGNLGSTFDAISQQRQNAPVEALKLRMLQQKADEGDLQIQAARGEMADKASLASALNAPGQTLTSIIPKQAPQADLTGMLGSMAPQQLQQFSMPQQEASPTVQAYNEGRVSSKTTKPDFDKVLLDHYMKTDPAKAQGMQRLLMDKFKALSEVDPAAAIKWYNGVSGMDLTYQGKKGDYSIVQSKDGAIVAVNTKNPSDMQVLQKGTPQPVPAGSAIPDGKGGWTVPAPKEAADKQQIVEIPSANGKTAQKYNYNLTTGEKIPIGAPYTVKSQIPNININGGGGDSEDVIAWAKAVKEGRATLQDVPNRGTVRSRVVKELENQGGVDYAANTAENKAFSGSLAQQQKQLGSMGSFVKNLDAQVEKVNELSQNLKTFDTRLLNVPLRAVRGRIAGSADQAKYDMYLTEIESEIGKLATGSSVSAAELSIGAQQKWAKIHDKNLSINDMLSLLKETSAAGKLRMKSVQDQLNETKSSMRNRGGAPKPARTAAQDPLGIL